MIRSTERTTIRWTPEEYAALQKHMADVRRTRGNRTGAIGVGTVVRDIVFATLGSLGASSVDPRQTSLSIVDKPSTKAKAKPSTKAKPPVKAKARRAK